MFEAPTVASLAAYIKQQQTEGTILRVGRLSAAKLKITAETPDDALEPPPIRRNPSGGEFPASFSQQRLWLLNQLDPASPAYNIPVVLMLDGALDVSALRRSFNEIARRHETLRTGFGWSGAGPVQMIASTAEIELPLIDLNEATGGSLDRA